LLLKGREEVATIPVAYEKLVLDLGDTIDVQEIGNIAGTPVACIAMEADPDIAGVRLSCLT
jgi:hypothetical protein